MKLLVGSAIMMRRMFHSTIILAILLVFASSSVAARSDRPAQRQIYRLIRMDNTARAGDMQWVEVWEQIDDDQNIHQLVMLEGKGSDSGVETHCYYALTMPGIDPVYVVDSVNIPVNDPDELWDQLANRRLLDQSLNFASAAECQVAGTETINGVEALRCPLDEDAAGLFFVPPTAKAQGNLWKASTEDFVVRYEFEAQGSESRVYHRYDLLPVSSVSSASAPQNMLCFDGQFPAPEDTEYLVNTPTYVALITAQSVEYLVGYYNGKLQLPWSLVSENTVDRAMRECNYARALDDQNRCRLRLRLMSHSQTDSMVIAEVFPSYVNPSLLPMPAGWETPVVVSAYSAAAELEGSVAEVLTTLLPVLEDDKWTMRVALTDIREESAFVTLERDGYELYLVLDGYGDSVSIRFQTRSATCGPTFEVP